MRPVLQCSKTCVILTWTASCDYLDFATTQFSFEAPFAKNHKTNVLSINARALMKNFLHRSQVSIAWWFFVFSGDRIMQTIQI